MPYHGGQEKEFPGEKSQQVTVLHDLTLTYLFNLIFFFTYSRLVNLKCSMSSIKSQTIL
jgi:predicted DNA-binding protein (MmcQ/YjbR family)